MDLSSIITHAQCTMGFECFDECGDEFPRENYIPWCTYVPNFQVKPKPNTFGIHGATASIGPPPSYSAATAVISLENGNQKHFDFNPYKLSVFLWDICKHCDPDQMPQNVVSDQDLHCLLKECFIKIWIH